MGIPDNIGPYRIIREIGRGPLGTVYLAGHPTLVTQVALKALFPDPSLSPTAPELTEARTGFRDYAMAVAQFSGPGIVGFHEFDAVEETGVLYIAMEYCEKGSLADLLRTSGKLAYAQARPMFLRIATSLQLIHSRGSSHRNLKPSNVLFSTEGAVLTDFGISKEIEDTIHTNPAEQAASLAYESPEALEHKEMDQRSDIHALGLLMYETLTGENPFRDIATRRTVRKVLEYDPPELPPDSAPEAVRVFVLHALSKEPADRPPDWDDLMEALKEGPVAAVHAPTPVMPERPVEIAAKIEPPRQMEAATDAQEKSEAGTQEARRVSEPEKIPETEQDRQPERVLPPEIPPPEPPSVKPPEPPIVPQQKIPKPPEVPTQPAELKRHRQGLVPVKPKRRKRRWVVVLPIVLGVLAAALVALALVKGSPPDSEVTEKPGSEALQQVFYGVPVKLAGPRPDCSYALSIAECDVNVSGFGPPLAEDVKDRIEASAEVASLGPGLSDVPIKLTTPLLPGVEFDPSPASTGVLVTRLFADAVFEDITVDVRGKSSSLVYRTSPGRCNITASGPPDLVAGDIRDQIITYIDVSGLGAGDYNVPLSADLPNGLLLSFTEPETISVSIATRPPEPEPASRSFDNIQIVLTGQGSSYQYVMSQRTCSVTFSGEESRVDNVSSGQISASVNVSGLGPGTHTVRISASGPSGVTVSGKSPSSIQVTITSRGSI